MTHIQRGQLQHDGGEVRIPSPGPDRGPRLAAKVPMCSHRSFQMVLGPEGMWPAAFIYHSVISGGRTVPENIVLGSSV